MNEHVHIRIDNRLLHGQVVQFWIPHLGIEQLIVADDEVANNDSMQEIYRMALPSIVTLKVVQVEDLRPELEGNQVHALLLIRDIPNAYKIWKNGVHFKRLTLGNVHASPERKRLTDAVYLSETELSVLKEMHQAGVEIEIQTFPGEVLRFKPDGKGGVGWVKS